MTISFVGSASAEATSLTLPAHQAGDLIVMFAGRTGSASPITVPTGWFGAVSRGLSTSSPALFLVVAWKIATSSAEVSGTWTGASAMQVVVVREAINYIVPGGAIFWFISNSTSVFYESLSAVGSSTSLNSSSMRGLSSFVMRFVVLNSNTSDGDAPPAGSANIVSFAGAGAVKLATHRTNIEVASISSATVTASASVGNVTATLELLNTGIAKSAGGGMLIHLGMSGGMRG